MTAGRYAMALGGGGRPMLRPFVSARGAHPQRTPRASCGPRPEAAGPSAGADRKGSIRISGADNAPGAGGGRGRAAAHGRGGPRGVGGLEAGAGGGRGDSPYHGYEVQRLARLVDHALPFSLLLLGVFIRQHLQGFFVMIWITSVMFNSNDILRKQTALKQATRLRERPCHCHDGCSFWPDRGMKTCGIPSFGRTSSSGGLHVMS
ncbi:translation initiation factor IF-2-like [Triticum urartu]|uniref:translation initiation factor IF-2-like n=1 Tax=Triticum urartu TaxID=4572 RepID=UPI0020439349|nr:translation initiation factor IF-2-like [Triticum urartu]XP_048570981.1 translation initiation factor IF-2-like [Triticum urartu]